MLEGIELFSSLSDNDKENLAMFCQERKLNSGEILFNEGDESTSMYVVKSGLLEAFMQDKILGTIGKGEFVGEMAIFDNPKVRSASVKAIEDSELLVLLDFSIQQLAKAHPEILSKIREVITERRKKNNNNYLFSLDNDYLK